MYASVNKVTYNHFYGVAVRLNEVVRFDSLGRPSDFILVPLSVKTAHGQQTHVALHRHDSKKKKKKTRTEKNATELRRFLQRCSLLSVI